MDEEKKTEYVQESYYFTHKLKSIYMMKKNMYLHLSTQTHKYIRNVAWECMVDIIPKFFIRFAMVSLTFSVIKIKKKKSRKSPKAHLYMM